MLLHIVLFSFNDTLDWNCPEIREAEGVTYEHPKYISEIKGWICGRNVTNRDIAADFVVIGLFNDVHDLESYINHPNHRVGVEKWANLANWKVADIEIAKDCIFNGGSLSVLDEIVNKSHEDLK